MVITSFFLYNMIFAKKTDFTKHSKYALTISVATKIGDTSQQYSINYKDDGINARINSNKLNYPVYISNGKLSYIDNNTIYEHNIKNSYRELDDIISSLKDADKIEEKANITRYTKLLTTQEIDKILNSLYIKSSSQDKAVLQFSIKNNTIESCNLTLNKVENFDLITIIIKFEELEEDYKVDISSLTGNNHGFVTFYEHKITEENVLEIK